MNFYYTLFITFIIITHHQSPQIDNHIIPVYGNASLGYYYVNLYVGTPPQEQSVIIDTGSGQLAVPCSKCTSCGRRHIHPPFDIMKSKTNKILTCVWNILNRHLNSRCVRNLASNLMQTLANSQFLMHKAVHCQA
jgi:hypothetical protein